MLADCLVYFKIASDSQKQASQPQDIVIVMPGYLCLLIVSVLGLANRGKNNHIIAVLWVGTQPNNFWDKISCSVLTEILTLLLMLVFDLSLGLERSKICHDCLINVQCIDNKNCTKCHHESKSHPSRDYKQQPTLKILLILIFNQPRTMSGQSHKYYSWVPAVLCEKPIYI